MKRLSFAFEPQAVKKVRGLVEMLGSTRHETPGVMGEVYDFSCCCIVMMNIQIGEQVKNLIDSDFNVSITPSLVVV